MTNASGMAPEDLGGDFWTCLGGTRGLRGQLSALTASLGRGTARGTPVSKHCARAIGSHRGLLLWWQRPPTHTHTAARSPPPNPARMLARPAGPLVCPVHRCGVGAVRFLTYLRWPDGGTALPSPCGETGRRNRCGQSPERGHPGEQSTGAGGRSPSSCTPPPARLGAPADPRCTPTAGLRFGAPPRGHRLLVILSKSGRDADHRTPSGNGKQPRSTFGTARCHCFKRLILKSVELSEARGVRARTPVCSPGRTSKPNTADTCPSARVC